MAKTPKIIPDFSGGLVTFTDPRDLQDKQCQTAENTSLRYIGRLKQLGLFEDNSDITTMSATLEGGSSVNFTNGQVFHLYATDVMKDNTLSSELYLAFVDKATGKLWVHDATNKAWEHLKPYDSSSGSFNVGNVQGIYGQIAASMTSNDKLDAVYYFSDGGLRICDPNFNNATQEGPSTMLWKGDWATTTAYAINDVVVESDKQYICLIVHSSSVFATELAASKWVLLNDQKASTMVLQHIKKAFFNNAISVNDWHCHPARCFPLVPSVGAVETGSLNQGLHIQSSTVGKPCSNGQIGFTLNLERDKGDGTLLMQGRKFYATLMYDNSQESLPIPIGTITLANIKTLAGAPDEARLGYEVKLSKDVINGDDNIHLTHKVNDQDSTSTFIPDDEKLNWDEAGTIKLVDNQNQTQILSYTGFAAGLDANNNKITNACTATDTNSSGGYDCTKTNAFNGFATNGMTGMFIKNTTTGSYGTITSNTVSTATCTSMTGAGTNGWTSGDTFLVEGITLTGVAGWTDTGSCNVSHVVSSVSVTSGGGDYNGTPTVVFTPTNGGSGAAATATMAGAGSTQSISSVTMTNHGSDYLSPPDITFTVNTGAGAANANITAELTLSDACVNNGGTWTTGDADQNNTVEYDPPGEIQKDDEKLGFRLTCSIEPKSQVNTREQLFDWNRGGNRVTKICIYTNKYSDDAGTIPESEDFAYVCSFNLENGYENEDGSYEDWIGDAVSTTQFNATTGWHGKMFATTFQNRTGMFPDTWSTGLRFKSSTIINRRVYAGNVYMKESGQGTEKSFPDRIVKSLPNQFDNFTDYDVLDVTVDDGDEIVALETFGGQLLQFKKSSLYVIDVTTEPEFIRASHKHRGIPSRYALAKTDFGVAFANAYGAFLYNGEIVSELSSNIIEDEWAALYDRTTNDIIVGFHPEFKVLFFTDGASSDFLVYDMVARSWMKGTGATRLSATAKSKFFVYNNQLVTAWDDTGIKFKKWNESLGSNLDATATFKWKSKEYDFGNPSTIKFVYKVYVTYKTEGVTTSQVQLRAFYNDGTGGSNATTGAVLTGALSGTSGVWNTIECVPSPRISCKTLELQLEQIPGQIVDYGFEVNDLVIIYREKSVR